ncbi:hypothetical protein [Actinoplanes friuliensis]|uniref:hypothetical protein n=1 Tax=Actinoplanes friuliensis TaxID=196914 RepID=UPI0011DCE7C7|nr:hypothetical protein [Actinoplanes friuliensis]
MTGSHTNGDSAYPRLSGTGRTVVFGSYASNLVAGDTNNNHDVFLRTFQCGEHEPPPLFLTSGVKHFCVSPECPGHTPMRFVCRTGIRVSRRYHSQFFPVFSAGIETLPASAIRCSERQ